MISKENIEQTLKSLRWVSFNLGKPVPNTFDYATKKHIENAINVIEQLSKLTDKELIKNDK